MEHVFEYHEKSLVGLLTRYNRMSNEEYERIFNNALDYHPTKSIVQNKEKRKVVKTK